MSVAFRREGDDEHKEPVFEIPIAPGPNLVTARGRALIDERIAAIDARIAVAEDEARAALMRELRYWHTRRATAEIVAPPEDGTIDIGMRVVFRLGDDERTITIVGGDEADPAAGLIGFQAPLARAIIGSEAGERVDFAGRAEAIHILAVEPT